MENIRGFFILMAKNFSLIIGSIILSSKLGSSTTTTMILHILMLNDKFCANASCNTKGKYKIEHCLSLIFNLGHSIKELMCFKISAANCAFLLKLGKNCVF